MVTEYTRKSIVNELNDLIELGQFTTIYRVDILMTKAVHTYTPKH